MYLVRVLRSAITGGMHSTFLLFVGLANPLGTTLQADASLAAPPNIVLLVADDLGWRDLGCSGSTFYETPNIDRLAGEGMLFSAAYAACPVCSPTRVALMTGKAPARLDTTDWFGGRRKGLLLPAPYVDRLPAAESTLAEALGAAGYSTGFFGKWHMGGKGSYPEDHGFDHNRGGHKRGSPPGGYFSPYRNPKLTDGPEGEHLTERLTTEALSWMDSLEEGPFLLVLSYYAVHTPLQTKPEYRERYRQKRETLPEVKDPLAGRERERRVRIVQNHAVYAGMVQSLDESVGRVLEGLAERGLAENTVVMFTSDNGGLSTSEGHPTSNLPLRGGKGWLYEGGVRVPAIVRWPRVTEPGSECSTPVWSADFYPTALQAAGLPLQPEQHVDGRSLKKLLAGGEQSQRALFWHYPHYGNQGAAPSGSVRDGNWKLIEWFEDDSVELFDLARDPGEQEDLAATEPKQVARLRGMLHSWRKSTDAKMPSRNR